MTRTPTPIPSSSDVSSDGDKVGQDLLDDGRDPAVDVADLGVEAGRAGGEGYKNEGSEDAFAFIHSDAPCIWRYDLNSDKAILSN